MKVFHIITHFDQGGAERIAVWLATAPDAGMERHIVEVAATEGPYREKMIRELQEQGVHLHPARIKGNKAGILLSPFRLLRLLRRFHPDIVHTHTEVPDLAFYLYDRLAGWAGPRVRVIRTIHNTTLWTGWERIGRHVERFYQGRGANVSIGESVCSSYAARYGERTPVVPNGVAGSPQLPFPHRVDGRLNILFAGRMEFQKGVDILADVISRLEEDGPWFFHIVGEGSMGTEVRTRLAGRKDVRFYDRIFSLASYMGAFDFLFMPSRFEGLALTPIEASLAGTPTVISGAPGLEETLPSDWPLKGRNADDFKYIFRKVLPETDRQELGERARRHAAACFSVEAMRAGYRRLYGRPRALFVLHLPPPVHGASLVGKQIRESAVINEAMTCRYVNLSTSQRMEEIGRFSWRKVADVFRLFHAVRKELRCFRPDLVYVTPTSRLPGILKDLPVVWMACRKGRRVFLHFHNKGVASRQDRWLDHQVYRRLFRDVDVILLSRLLYPDVCKYVPAERVHFCANGIAPMPLAAIGRQDSPVILFLSNLIPEKGPLILLEACRILLDRGIAFRCDMAGRATATLTEDAFLNRIEGLGLQDCVRYLGPRYDGEKAACFSDADVFVLPTYYPHECFPLSILEAMSAGLPVVATTEGAIPELVVDGETGLLCPRHDAPALADALQRLLEDPDLRRSLGEAGKLRFHTHYTDDQFLNRLKSILLC